MACLSAVALLLDAATCTPNHKDAAVTHRASPDDRRPQEVIETSTGRTQHFYVEIADTPKAREVGLMFRKELADNAGMVFVFEAQYDQHFWMKNTYIPLDMIFIGDDLKVAGIIHRAAPETEKSLSVGKPSRYVLEVNGGLAQRAGIVEGAKVTFKGFAPQ